MNEVETQIDHYEVEQIVATIRLLANFWDIAGRVVGAEESRSLRYRYERVEGDLQHRLRATLGLSGPRSGPA